LHAGDFSKAIARNQRLRNLSLPFVQANGVRHFYRLDGRDDRPAIIFSHSLGVDHGQWDKQAADLLPNFRVLRYDLRGHGASDASKGDYSIELLGRDVLAIADAAGLAQFPFWASLRNVRSARISTSSPQYVVAE